MIANSIGAIIGCAAIIGLLVCEFIYYKNENKEEKK